jgi:hypothetical protein
LDADLEKSQVRFLRSGFVDPLTPHHCPHQAALKAEQQAHNDLKVKHRKLEQMNDDLEGKSR